MDKIRHVGAGKTSLSVHTDTGPLLPFRKPAAPTPLGGDETNHICTRVVRLSLRGWFASLQISFPSPGRHLTLCV